MREMIEIIARAIVDEPELVTVIEVGGMHSSTPELTVAKEDISSSVSSAVSSNTKKTNIARNRGLMEKVGILGRLP